MTMRRPTAIPPLSRGLIECLSEKWLALCDPEMVSKPNGEYFPERRLQPGHVPIDNRISRRIFTYKLQATAAVTIIGKAKYAVSIPFWNGHRRAGLRALYFLTRTNGTKRGRPDNGK